MQLEIEIDEKLEIPEAISCLTSDASEKMLEKLLRQRNKAISTFWQQCRKEPREAEKKCAGQPLIMQDLYLLAQNHSTDEPDVDDILSEIRAVMERDLIWDFNKESTSRDKYRWSEINLIGLFIDGDKQLKVFDYFMGPFFDCEPEDLRSQEGPDWALSSIECREDNGAQSQYVRARLVVYQNEEGEWVRPVLKSVDCDRLFSLADSTSQLMSREKLSYAGSYETHLPSFPHSSDITIRHIRRHMKTLYAMGRRTEAERDRVQAMLAPFRAKIDLLRQERSEIEAKIHLIEKDMFEIEATVLEQETGFSRGDFIHHKETGKSGILEMGSNYHVGFRLEGTYSNIDGELRRGEWVVAEQTIT